MRARGEIASYVKRCAIWCIFHFPQNSLFVVSFEWISSDLCFWKINSFLTFVVQFQYSLSEHLMQTFPKPIIHYLKPEHEAKFVNFSCAIMCLHFSLLDPIGSLERNDLSKKFMSQSTSAVNNFLRSKLGTSLFLGILDIFRERHR